MQTPRELGFSSLAGEKPHRVPFIIWNNKLPSPAIERRLLELGACIIVKSNVWRSHFDGIEVRRDQLPPTTDGHPRTRTVYRTPAGEVSEINVSMPNTSWREKHLFESAADYDAIEAVLLARRHTPAFDVFRADDKRYPGACLARPITLHSPMHEVIYEIMGIENFCLELADNREHVLRLVELVTADVKGADGQPRVIPAFAGARGHPGARALLARRGRRRWPPLHAERHRGFARPRSGNPGAAGRRGGGVEAVTRN